MRRDSHTSPSPSDPARRGCYSARTDAATFIRTADIKPSNPSDRKCPRGCHILLVRGCLRETRPRPQRSRMTTMLPWPRRTRQNSIGTAVLTRSQPCPPLCDNGLAHNAKRATKSYSHVGVDANDPARYRRCYLVHAEAANKSYRTRSQPCQPQCAQRSSKVSHPPTNPTRW